MPINKLNYVSSNRYSSDVELVSFASSRWHLGRKIEGEKKKKDWRTSEVNDIDTEDFAEIGIRKYGGWLSLFYRFSTIAADCPGQEFFECHIGPWRCFLGPRQTLIGRSKISTRVKGTRFLVSFELSDGFSSRSIRGALTNGVLAEKSQKRRGSKGSVGNDEGTKSTPGALVSSQASFYNTR